MIENADAYLKELQLELSEPNAEEAEQALYYSEVEWQRWTSRLAGSTPDGDESKAVDDDDARAALTHAGRADSKGKRPGKAKAAFQSAGTVRPATTSQPPKSVVVDLVPMFYPSDFFRNQKPIKVSSQQVRPAAELLFWENRRGERGEQVDRPRAMRAELEPMIAYKGRDAAGSLDSTTEGSLQEHPSREGRRGSNGSIASEASSSSRIGSRILLTTISDEDLLADDAACSRQDSKASTTSNMSGCVSRGTSGKRGTSSPSWSRPTSSVAQRRPSKLRQAPSTADEWDALLSRVPAFQNEMPKRREVLTAAGAAATARGGTPSGFEPARTVATSTAWAEPVSPGSARGQSQRLRAGCFVLSAGPVPRNRNNIL
eukprot:TRINITY_DN9430_c0_g1_i1.p1 TRINITY_DN9430_c0_g1~~TRINITY_DN9430_c0_g1_i1.p1  ORF type:complete len:373 (+),score=57.99 TRINITY_DN9430_c0_g1_i1:129-1247(+)